MHYRRMDGGTNWTSRNWRYAGAGIERFIIGIVNLLLVRASAPSMFTMKRKRGLVFVFVQTIPCGFQRILCLQGHVSLDDGLVEPMAADFKQNRRVDSLLSLTAIPLFRERVIPLERAWWATCDGGWRRRTSGRFAIFTGFQSFDVFPYLADSRFAEIASLDSSRVRSQSFRLLQIQLQWFHFQCLLWSFSGLWIDERADVCKSSEPEKMLQSM